MIIHPWVAEILRDPRNGRELKRDPRGFISTVDGKTFPLLDAMPWLFPDPEGSLWEWRDRVSSYLSHISRKKNEFQSNLSSASQMPLSSARLRTMIDSYGSAEKQLQEILSPLSKLTNAFQIAKGLAPVLPNTQRLMSYEANIFRDWCWGDEENQSYLELIAQFGLGEQNLGKVLILGSGACRFTADVTRQWKTDGAVAFDINPFLMLIGAKILSGNSVELTEFPIAPKTASHWAVTRCLERKDLSTNLPITQILGDADNLPFAPESFDTVFTPWFIDIVDIPLPVLAHNINALLKPKGKWCNFGSLVFMNNPPHTQYEPEEVKEIVKSAKFDDLHWAEKRMPYLASPASCQHRNELVSAFIATKGEHTKEILRHRTQRDPTWIADPKLPIPQTSALQGHATTLNVVGDVLALIDGKRNLDSLALDFSAKYGLNPKEGVSMLRSVMRKLWAEGNI